MGFSSKRGRPKKFRASVDKGTKELQQKRRNNLTVESIDLLLGKSLISEEQHRSALHLRWLFTIKNGAPNISASSYDQFDTNNFRSDANDWQESREAEYNFAIESLQAANCHKAVIDIVVYDQLRLPMRAEELSLLRDGLRLLCKQWQRKRK